MYSRMSLDWYVSKLHMRCMQQDTEFFCKIYGQPPQRPDSQSILVCRRSHKARNPCRSYAHHPASPPSRSPANAGWMPQGLRLWFGRSWRFCLFAVGAGRDVCVNRVLCGLDLSIKFGRNIIRVADVAIKTTARQDVLSIPRFFDDCSIKLAPACNRPFLPHSRAPLLALLNTGLLTHVRCSLSPVAFVT